AYPPPGGKGPIVLLLSGHSGPDSYRPIAAAVARLGYYAVLLDGKDILTREQDGRGNLRQAIARAQASPYALSDKTAVIGFSQGGGAALVHAADMPEVVSAVVAYYPQTNFVADASLIARRFQVPVLILAGQRDTYHNCCLIESIRAIGAGGAAGSRARHARARARRRVSRRLTRDRGFRGAQQRRRPPRSDGSRALRRGRRRARNDARAARGRNVEVGARARGLVHPTPCTSALRSRQQFPSVYPAWQ